MARRAASKVKYWVGFDLGGTKMVAAVFGPKFKLVAQARRKTKGFEGSKAGVARVIETIEMALRDGGISPRDLGGIGIGSPGPLDLNKGLILDTPNLGWKRVALRDRVAGRFGRPVALANDVDAGTYGEYRRGAARGARCAVGVFLGTGIGGGCVYEGKLLRGRTGSCFEIGHCRVLPEGPLCGCGRRGCLEAVAGRLAISAAALCAAYRGEAPRLLKENGGMDLAGVRSSVLAAAVNGGDRAVERVVREAARWVGAGVATAVNLVAPDVVVLGGGLVTAMPDLFVEEVEDAARRAVMPTFRDAFRVEVARLGDRATVVGAAALVQDMVEGAGNG